MANEAASRLFATSSLAPAAMPSRRRFALDLCSAQLRPQYITAPFVSRTVMRHDLAACRFGLAELQRLPSLPITLRPTCVGEAARAAALVPATRLAQRGTARPRAAFTAAVALSAVAGAAHDRFATASQAHEPACTGEPGAGGPAPDLARRLRCRHRRARSIPERALRGRSTPRLDVAFRRCNTLPALVVIHGGARRSK